jgi:peptidoglycan/xylan/chitin deacetylase (PgdA/CDA1 family)
VTEPRTTLGRALPPRITDAIRIALAAGQAVRLALSGRRVGLVLLYHRLEERAGDPARELVPAVAVGEFRRQLRWLTRLFRIVPAASILAEATGRGRGRRVPVAITFDDEWPTHADLALPALRAVGATATFFLTGAHLRERTPFWWESLQHAADTGAPVGDLVAGDDVFEQAVAITAADPRTRRRMSAQLRARAGPETRSGATPDEIRLLATDAEVGFHTREHDTLTALSDAELEEALRAGRDELEAVAGRPLRLVAYPHGAAGEREARAAQRAGFALGFTAEHEPCGPDSDPWLIGRVEPGVVPIGTFLRIVTDALG